MNNSTVLPSLNNAQSKFLEIRKGIVVSHRIIRQRDKRTATGTSVRTQYEIRFDGHTSTRWIHSARLIYESELSNFIEPLIEAPTMPTRSQRVFEIGERVCERPGVKSSINGSPVPHLKHGTLVGIEKRKIMSRKAKAGYALRTFFQVQWDGRTAPDWIQDSRIIHEHELDALTNAARLAVGE
jgi:hypothetical protein